jgi:flagellar assembly factor FliW
MPTAHSEQFGELEYTEESLLLFPRGLPSFEHARRFVLIEQPQHAPLVHLQSLENASLCFLAAPIRQIEPHYELQLNLEDQELIRATDSVLELALLSATTDGQISANLLAPIVIDLPTRVAVQSVRSDTRYSHQHPLGEATTC